MDEAPYLRKPPWLKVRPASNPACGRVSAILAEENLSTVCREARCPNRAECFASGTATFLLLGNVCTRGCRYCNVAFGTPAPLDRDEPRRVVAAVQALNLSYVVLTSVTRDDLPDGGAEIFADTVAALRDACPACRIETLIPDFQGNAAALAQVLAARPDVLNHNVEVVPRLYPALRPRGSYARSLAVLREASAAAGIVTKSGFMIGFGEAMKDIEELLEDLRRAACARVTVGQYQQPNRAAWPVRKYYTPEEFAAIRETALSLGFAAVEAGPLVRSSYHAARMGA